jgi:hypothetical protein
MTDKQAIMYAIHHCMTPTEIDDLAGALASCPAGRRAAGKAIASGKRILSEETKQHKADLIRERTRARMMKQNIKI